MIQKYRPYASWALASFFYAYQYILRVLPNITMPEIMARFEIDAAVFGQISGIYYIGYAAMHIPLGVMFDRIGPKRVMPACILMSAFGLLPLIFSSLWVFPLVGRLLVGIGSSGAILGVFKITRMTFPESRFARMLGFSVTIGLLGAIYGGAPLASMLENFGFEPVIYALIMLGVFLAVGVYVLVPNLEKSTKKSSVYGDILEVIRNPGVVSLCLISGLMVGPLEGFADVWGVEFLKKVYEIDMSQAAFLTSLIFIGMCVGAPILPVIAEKTKSYLGWVAVSAVVMALAFIGILFFSLSINSRLLSVLFFIIGFFCAYQILAIYIASTFVRPELSGVTTAFVNMIIMPFGYVFHSSIGNLMVWFSGTDKLDDIGTYSSTAYVGAISIIPAALMLALVGLIILMFNRRNKNAAR